jgi:hypothetical protein
MILQKCKCLSFYAFALLVDSVPITSLLLSTMKCLQFYITICSWPSILKVLKIKPIYNYTPHTLIWLFVLPQSFLLYSCDGRQLQCCELAHEIIKSQGLRKSPIQYSGRKLTLSMAMWASVEVENASNRFSTNSRDLSRQHAWLTPWLQPSVTLNHLKELANCK